MLQTNRQTQIESTYKKTDSKILTPTDIVASKQGRILLVANIEDGSSLIIHWSSGSHKRATNWANQYDIYLVGPLLVGHGAMAPRLPKSGPASK